MVKETAVDIIQDGNRDRGLPAIKKSHQALASNRAAPITNFSKSSKSSRHRASGRGRTGEM
eukprot:8269016-Pyramimonas_sp.AAC.1